MPIVDVDNIEVDELETAFLAILSDHDKDVYIQLGTDVERLQFIITLIEDDYLPYFNKDDLMSSLLAELDVLVDVNDPNFELSADVIDIIVNISTIARNDNDVPDSVKGRLLVILTYMLELVEG
jgi:hypothetical protein